MGVGENEGDAALAQIEVLVAPVAELSGEEGASPASMVASFYALTCLPPHALASPFGAAWAEPLASPVKQPLQAQQPQQSPRQLSPTLPLPPLTSSRAHFSCK